MGDNTNESDWVLKHKSQKTVKFQCRHLWESEVLYWGCFIRTSEQKEECLNPNLDLEEAKNVGFLF